MNNRLAAAGAVALLLLAGCAGKPAAERPDFAAAPTDLKAVAGCAEQADFALAADPEKGPTRCAPGSPAAQPLDERQKVTVAMSTKTAEFAAPIVMAEALGEFDKENLDVEINVLPPADSIQLLADGKIDAIASTSSAAFYNALSQGFDVRWVLGQGWSNADSKAGLWAAGRDVKLADLKGASLGSAVGVGSSANLHFVDLMKDAGVGITDVSFQTVDVADSVTALSNGSLDAAMILDPFWLPLKDDPNFTFLAHEVEPGGSNGGVYYGPSILERRDVGLAFARAFIRTIDTYLAGDYKADPEALRTAADAIGLPVDQLGKTPSYHYSWDVSTGLTDRHQAMYQEAKILQYEDPIPEDRIVDRSFVAEAVGIERP